MTRLNEILSVGSTNQHKHPRPEVMAALLRARVLPICTQMTAQCSPDLEAHRQQALPMIYPSRSVSRRDINKNNRSKNVACASTILLEVNNNGFEIQRLDTHQGIIDRLHIEAGTPLCRARRVSGP